MSLYYQDDRAVVYHGDCLEIMADMPTESVDSIVCDPPYGLGFMGRTWDALPPGKEWAEACLRVLKPGGHLLAFGGARTWHRLAVAIEDGGFEIRDSIAWLYGAGFPKSLDVSKAIDKAAGAEREVVGVVTYGDGHVQRSTETIGYHGSDPARDTRNLTAPATPESALWQGWGTALKPAFEPVVVARKPLIGTVAANVLEHGTGALNIDVSRVATDEDRSRPPRTPNALYGGGKGTNLTASESAPGGRWPANVILDESQAEALDQQSGTLTSGKVEAQHQRAGKTGTATFGDYAGIQTERGYGDSGGASRFFYVAKAARHERPNVNGITHPTVKPLALMQWLVRLVTPTGGTVLDPFAGSGTTMEAAITEGFNSIGIEITDEYLPLIKQRLQKPHQVAFNFNTSEAT